MSLENYAVHVAPRGGKIDLIVDAVDSARDAAHKKRLEYSRSKGAAGTYGTDSHLAGLIFKDETAVPDGWSVTGRESGCVVATPKAKDKTKISRAAAKVLRDEMSALPRLPGAWEFTNEIGGSQCIINDGGRMCLASCFYERIGETTFVFTPWVTEKSDENKTFDENTGTGKKTAFLPEGCERVGLSVYYAAKEKAAA